MLLCQACNNKSKGSETRIDNLVTSKISPEQVEIGFTSNSDDHLKIESILTESVVDDARKAGLVLASNKNNKITSSKGKLLYGVIRERYKEFECSEVVDTKSGKMLMFISFIVVRGGSTSYIYEVSIYSDSESDYSESIVEILKKWSVGSGN